MFPTHVIQFSNQFLINKNVRIKRLIEIVRGQLVAGAYDYYCEWLQSDALVLLCAKKNQHIFKPFYSKKESISWHISTAKMFHLKFEHPMLLQRKNGNNRYDCLYCKVKSEVLFFSYCLLAHSFLTSVQCAYWDFFLHHGTPKAEIKFKFYCRHEKKSMLYNESQKRIQKLSVYFRNKRKKLSWKVKLGVQIVATFYTGNRSLTAKKRLVDIFFAR